MARPKRAIGLLVLLVATLLCSVLGYSVNTTVYDTDLEHVSYGPTNNFCASWMNWIFWHSCWTWAQPWNAAVIHNGRQFTTVHRSLNHQLPTLTVQFRGSAVWLYGPSRAQLYTIPPEYKICLYENHHLASDPVCYRVDVAEAYSAVDDRDEPVVIFAKGNLQYQEHRVVVSVADPIDETGAHDGIAFSHAVYTTERPTPWPVEEDSWRFRRVVMHDTHPLLSYVPGMPTTECTFWWWWCQSQNGWIPRTYRAEDGSIVSWHELKSENDDNMREWGVQATFTAGAVAVYGIPRSHVSDTSNLSPICVQIDSGHCDAVDLRHVYLNSPHDHESVLLWKHDALDPSRSTHLSIRLLDTGHNGLSVFPFKEIHYFESQEYASPNPPVGHLENHDVRHDNWGMTYHPGRRCTRHFLWWCTRWFDPWVWKEVGPPESRLTYRSAVSYYRTTEDPSITVDFRGSAVYVYGAPRSFISDPFASQRICINDNCRIIDVEQAYLNAPLASNFEAVSVTGGPRMSEIGASELHENELNEQGNSTAKNITALSGFHPELEPVLIWSMTGLDDNLPHRLRLALAELPCADNAEMTIARVIYTGVTYDWGQSRPEIPIPRPDPGYRGPPYPPHAAGWVVGAPLPPLPAPPQTRAWQIVLILTFPPFLFLIFLCLLSEYEATSEREPLLADTQSDCNSRPPLYQPQPPHSGRSSSTGLSRHTPPTPGPTAPAPAPAQRRSEHSQKPSPPSRVDGTQPSSSRVTLGGSSVLTPQPRTEHQNNSNPAPRPDLTSPTAAPSIRPAEAPSQSHQTQRTAPSTFSPPSYSQPPSYYTGSRLDMLSDSLTVVSEASTVLPSYRDALNESHTRLQRAAEFATEQRALLQSRPPPPPLRNQVPQPSNPVAQARAPVPTTIVETPPAWLATAVPAPSSNHVSAVDRHTARAHQTLQIGNAQPSARETAPARIPAPAMSQARSRTPGAILQPAPTPLRVATNPSNVEERVAIAPPRSSPVQTREQAPDHNSTIRWANNQQRAFTPALSQWAAASGHDLNRLLDAASRPPRAPSRTGARSPTAQLQGVQQRSGQSQNTQSRPPNRDSYGAITNNNASGSSGRGGTLAIDGAGGRGGRGGRGGGISARGGYGSGGSGLNNSAAENPNARPNYQAQAETNNRFEGSGGRGGYGGRRRDRRRRGQETQGRNQT